MVNSIKKGKSFEREIANLLTENTGFKFYRVPQSGAFATNNNSEDSRFDGDVFSEHESFQKVVIECKSYSSFSINDFFNPKSLLFKWIKQAETECRNKHWLLFFKINNKGVYLIHGLLVDDTVFLLNKLDKSDCLQFGDCYKLYRLKI